ncbi:MaoC family dehydratase N-terminal domain-containing protein [Micromonospora sp. STR1s_5]|nr:MaoC family dehydratase N-terminal domain-containing protein [Micromonospora sp. STR1s_5]
MSSFKPIEIDKLTSFEIPSVRETLTPNAIALYALSIGMGRDPLDVRQLAFVDPLRGPAVMPSMVLVMAHPGFWLGDPRTGVDPKAVLHAAQGFEIVGPIPSSGVVESHTRITNVDDKGEGKPALIQSETELGDASGTIFARLARTTFVRGGGGFGGSSGPAAQGQENATTPPEVTVDLTTRAEQALLYRLNGDLNPLHSDPEIASQAGFDGPILHGLCTMGVVTHAVLRVLADYRAERLRSIKLRFSKPVYPGETIRTEIWSDGRFRARLLERDTVVIDDGLVQIDPPGLRGRP